MKILFVNKLEQRLDTKTEDLEHVTYHENGEIKHIPTWKIVETRSEPQFDLRESNFELINSLKQIEKLIENNNKKLENDNSDIRLDGIYLYKINSFKQNLLINGETKESILHFIQYDYIKTNINK